MIPPHGCGADGWSVKRLGEVHLWGAHSTNRQTQIRVFSDREESSKQSKWKVEAKKIGDSRMDLSFGNSH